MDGPLLCVACQANTRSSHCTVVVFSKTGDTYANLSKMLGMFEWFEWTHAQKDEGALIIILVVCSMSS